MSAFSTCHVCVAAGRTATQEPVDYFYGRKDYRLYRWLKFHAKKGIRLHGIGPSINGAPAEGKHLLSRTIGWDLRTNHDELVYARNRFCDIARRNPDLNFNLWRLDFDYQGALYFTDDARVVTDLGLVYRKHRATVNIREMQMAEIMRVNPHTNEYTQLVGVLEQASRANFVHDEFLVNSGLNLRDKIVGDGGFPTWDRARIAGEVGRLDICDFPTQVEVVRLLSIEAGCP